MIAPYVLRHFYGTALVLHLENLRSLQNGASDRPASYQAECGFRKTGDKSECPLARLPNLQFEAAEAPANKWLLTHELSRLNFAIRVEDDHVVRAPSRLNGASTRAIKSMKSRIRGGVGLPGAKTAKSSRFGSL